MCALVATKACGNESVKIVSTFSVKMIVPANTNVMQNASWWWILLAGGGYDMLMGIELVVLVVAVAVCKMSNKFDCCEVERVVSPW